MVLSARQITASKIEDKETLTTMNSKEGWSTVEGRHCLPPPPLLS